MCIAESVEFQSKFCHTDKRINDGFIYNQYLFSEIPGKPKTFTSDTFLAIKKKRPVFRGYMV